MNRITITREEAGILAFSDMDLIQSMDSEIPVNERESIRRRLMTVDRIGNSIRISPVGSELRVVVPLTDEIEDDSDCIVGISFQSGTDSIDGRDFAFCAFEGGLDINGRNLGSMRMIGCVFEGPTDIESCVFGSLLDMSCSRFIGRFDAEQLISCGRTNFGHCVFAEDAIFNSVEFRGKCLFSSTIFESKADFRDTVFFSKALFNRLTMLSEKIHTTPAEFRKEADFTNASFREYALFVGTKFNGEAKFNSSTFFSKAFFKGIDGCRFTAESGISFKSVRFGMYATISNGDIKKMNMDSVTCSGDLTLADLTFDTEQRFSNVIVKGYMKISSPVLPAGCGLSFIDANLGDLDIDLQYGLLSDNAGRLSSFGLESSWVGGHLQVVGRVDRLCLKSTNFGGPVKLIMAKNRLGRVPLDLDQTKFNASVEFKWVDVETTDSGSRTSIKEWTREEILESVDPEASASDVWVIRKPFRGRDASNAERCAELSRTMLQVRNVFEREGDFDSSDFFLRKYNDYVRRSLRFEKGTRLDRLGMTVSCLFGSYGTDVRRLLTLMVIIPLLFAVFLHAMGLEAADSLLDSYVAFLTMGLGVDKTGMDTAICSILIVDGFIGVFSMSFFVTSMARKLFRRSVCSRDLLEMVPPC